MNNHTYSIYNSLVKRAGMIMPLHAATGAPGFQTDTKSQNRVGTLTGQDRTQEPKTQPAINPVTGGTRIMYKGRPIGPVSSDHSFRQGPLPITPYSSGKISIDTMQQARQQAANVDFVDYFNKHEKQENAQNLDVMFEKLHKINQMRRSVGLPDYTPNAMDIYAPNANSKEDYANAENRIQEDSHLSTIVQEAARRGTPYNPAELRELKRLLFRQIGQIDPPTHMGLALPKGSTPDNIGQEANGVYNEPQN